MEKIWHQNVGKGAGIQDTRNISGPPPHYSQTTGHPIKLENFSIVDRESQGIIRTITEAMYIRVNDPASKRNLGKYQLSCIWDGELQDMLARSIYSDPLHTPTPQTHSGPPQARGVQNSSFVVSMSFSGVPPCPSLHPFSTFWCHIFLPNFGTKV